MGFSLSITLSVILISFSKIENFVDAEENETQKKKKINEYNMLLVDNFNKKKIKFISTPYDLESVEILKSLKTNKSNLRKTLNNLRRTEITQVL